MASALVATMICLISLSLAMGPHGTHSSSRLFPSVHGQRDSRDQDKTLHHLPDGLRQAKKVQKREDGGQSERAAKCGRHRALAAQKLRSAKHGGSDRLKF